MGISGSQFYGHKIENFKMEACHDKIIALPTFNVLVRFVGIIFDNHLDEVHALYNKTLENNSLASLGEHVADGELQRMLNERDERPWVIFQEVQQLVKSIRGYVKPQFRSTTSQGIIISFVL